MLLGLHLQVGHLHSYSKQHAQVTHSHPLSQHKHLFLSVTVPQVSLQHSLGLQVKLHLQHWNFNYSKVAPV